MPTKKIIPEFAELVAAIKANDVSKLESTLAAGVDVNGTDVLGRTLLMTAAEVGSGSMVKLLLTHRAKLATRDRLNFHDAGGKTALHRAVQGRRHEVVQLLITAGADMEVRDKLGETALHFSVANGDLPMTDLLLDSGAAPNGSGSTGTPLTTAAIMGFTNVAKSLLSHGADPNHPADARRPVLGCAVFAKKPELCRILITAGAREDATDHEGRTAMDSVGLTAMPDIRGIKLTSDQMTELREKVAAAVVIRSLLLEAGAAEKIYAL